MRRAIRVLVLVLIAPSAASACTTFCLSLDGRTVFGANYDWDTGVALMMVNKRSVAKVALTGRPARWTSRFASITVNQYGRDFPTGGMNEAGLVVALMALDVTRYPAVDSRPSVGILGWIQYQLDLSATIDEVIVQSEGIRIAGGMGLHYLVADRTGRAATIEYLDGALVVHRDAALPVAALTNNTYDDSVRYLRTIAGFGGTRPVPSGIDSLERFARAASMMRQVSDSADLVNSAFSILQSVRQPGYTRWSIVYDSDQGAVYFRTDRNSSVRWLSFDAMDPMCASPVRILDINQAGSGDMSAALADYTPDANTHLVYTAFSESPSLGGVSEEDRQATAMHPEGDICLQRRSRSVRP